MFYNVELIDNKLKYGVDMEALNEEIAQAVTRYDSILREFTSLWDTYGTDKRAHKRGKELMKDLCQVITTIAMVKVLIKEGKDSVGDYLSSTLPNENKIWIDEAISRSVSLLGHMNLDMLALKELDVI